MSNTVPTSTNTQERITAARITEGVVIAVERRGEQLITTRRKRNVIHATVTSKDVVPLVGMKERGYLIRTTAGDIEPVRGITSFPLISAPQVPAGAPDASAVVVGGTVVAMVERFDLVDAVTDPGQLWNAYNTEYALADAADGPAPVADDMKPRVETFRGRKLRTAKGAEWGQIIASVNGEVVQVANGSNPARMNEICRQLRRDVVAADERRVTDADAYPEHWYKGAPVPAVGPATVAWKLHNAREEQAMRDQAKREAEATCPDPYGHRPGTPGCVVTVESCNGIPTGITGNITERPITHPAQTGADEIGAEIAGILRHRFTVGDVTTGHTDPSRNRGIREVSTWSVTADGHTVTALRYTGRDTDLSALKDYVCVLVDGVSVGTARTVEPADIARVARDFIVDLPAPAVESAPAEEIGSELAETLAALIGDDVPAPAVDQVEAPAVAEVLAPAITPQSGSVRVTLTDGAGDVVRDWSRPSWNSGIRDSERAVREIARQEGAPYSGRKPERAGTPGTVTDTYTRVWASSFGILTATVTRPVPAVVPTQGPATVPAETVAARDAYQAERFEHYRAAGEDWGTADKYADGDTAAHFDAPAVTVTIEERPSGTPVVEPSPGAPFAPPAPVVPDVQRPDVPAGMPYVIDAPADWSGDAVTLSGAEYTRTLKRFLTEWFPGGKFSVRSHGGSVSVRWSGGPASSLVDLVAGMWWGEGRDSLNETNYYRGVVLHVAGNGAETAYRLPATYVTASREYGTAYGDVTAARRFLPDGVAEFVYGDFSDPYGRPWYGGSADECARWMADNGVTESTRTAGDSRPVCPVERCADAAGHPYPGMHRDHYGRAFLATVPTTGDEGDQGGNGGTPTDVDPVGPAPAGDQVDAPALADDAPRFRTWEELAAWIGGAALLDPARYAVTAPGADVPVWAAAASQVDPRRLPSVLVLAMARTVDATTSFECPAHGTVTVPDLYDSERVATAERAHASCTPPADVRNLYTVTNNARGTLKVHTIGCRDIGRDVRRNGVEIGSHWDVRADDLADIVCDLYDDATREDWQDFAGDITVMPCAGPIPDDATAPATPAVAEEIRPTITVRPWVTAHVDQVDAPAVAEEAPAPVKVGPVKVADLVKGDRVHVYGVDQYGSPTQGAGYLIGAPGPVTVKGRTKSGRLSKSDKGSRPGLVLQLGVNPGGWNGARMVIVTTPDAMAEYVTDADAHQFRPAAEAGNAWLCRARCSCGWKGGPGASRFFSERVQWDKHAAPADETVRTVVTPEELATAKRLGAEAHQFGCSAPVPDEDAEFQRLVRELPEHVSPLVLVNMYARGYAESAEREAVYLEQSQQIGAANLEVAEKVAALNPATQWAVDSQRAAIESAGRTLEARRAEAAAGRALADDTAEQPAPAGDGEDEGGAGTIYGAPMEWYAPQVDSDDDADITIMHDHEDGTVLHGSRRGDGVYEIAKAHGFDWRRNVGIFIPRSRDQFSQLKRIRECADALRLAGHTVAVMIDDVWRPAAVREEARGARVDARVERLTARSLKQSAAGDARREAARRIMDGMPFGEPVKMDHYSAPRHLRAFERIENNQRAAHAAYDYAQHLAGRADGAASNEDAKQGPRAIMRRIERLEADQREAQRRLDEAAGARAANSARYWWLNLERITEDIAYQRAKLGDLAETGAFVAWGPNHFEKDDEANIGGRWYRVVRVSAKSLSLDGLYTPGYVERAKWDRVHGRRRDGVQLDTPNGKPRDIEQAKRVERWAKLTRHLTCASYDRTPEQESKRRHFAQARRVVLGLARTATAQEVDAFGEPTGEQEQHTRALAMLAAFERLEAGETFDQVAADTQPIGDTVPAWTVPAGEPERVNVRDLVPGDFVRGTYDNFAGVGERLVTCMVGPVTAPPKITDRRESGEWYALEVDGETYEGKTFRRVAAHLIGAR